MIPKNRVTTHPGEILQEEFLNPLGISQSSLARHIGVRHFVICNLVHGKRSVTPRLALMLGRALGTSPEFWMGLQSDFDVSSFLNSTEAKRAMTIKPLAQAGS